MTLLNKYTFRILFTLILCVVTSFVLSAEGYTPQMVTNVNLRDPSQFIFDPTGALTSSQRQELNSTLYSLRKSSTAEMGVIIVPEIEDMTIEEFSQDVFKLWGLGKKDVNNGLILVVDLGNREVRLQPGDGMEGILPDITCAEIIRHDFIPQMREGNLAGAIAATLARVDAIIQDPAAAEEIRSSRSDYEQNFESEITPEMIMNIATLIVVVSFLISLCFWIWCITRMRGKDRYHRAMFWRERESSFMWMAIFSLGLGAVFYWLAKLRVKRYRTRPIKCSTCGTPMHKLSEEEDNALLNASQDFEEQLNSVDYDVWECPDCHTIERYAFPSKKTKYKKCPACGTVAEALVTNKVLVQPTTRREGVGVRIYECQFCHNKREERYKIPRKNDGSGVAAAAAAGAILGGSRGGGGFSGGGFGGGISSGGGATGRW